ncbi:PQQ-dependent sugar dehydrogenase [Microbulbifer sp. JMSA004]|uniref:PQQ-dependent sugar dehydrogenase n=1 Tax=Microbulbifer sp. JMSA004 TaxID=3243370 RepID=UPI0040391CBE
MNNTRSIFFKYLSFLSILFPSICFSGNYLPLNSSCDGFPKVAVGSIKGTCIGIVSQFSGFKKPRKAIQLGKRSLLITDMGGWSEGKGILWLLESSDDHLKGNVTVTPLLHGLNMPHDIEMDPKGRILVAETNQIRRLELVDNQIVSDEVIIGNLPHKDSLHPLSNFVQLPDNSLLINFGSRTDQCERHITDGKCNELDENGLWQYSYKNSTDSYSATGRQIANGLRNSMALVAHSSGVILQAENSSDVKDADEPYEEINIIREDGFYGWPYCLNEMFDQGKIKNGCHVKNYHPPYTLLPPHVAPLDMLYSQSSKIPALNNRLLMSWHGYRVVGNRLVAYDIDHNGLPVLTDKVWFNRDPIAPSTEWTRHPFAPQGGMSQQAQHIEIITNWNQVHNLRPEGAPVGLVMLMDETLLIVDDKNRAILRLATGESYISEEPITDDDDIDAEAMATILDKHPNLKNTLIEHCASCHEDIAKSPEKLLNNTSGWLKPTDGVMNIELALFNPVRPMPPSSTMSKEQKQQLINSIKSIFD